VTAPAIRPARDDDYPAFVRLFGELHIPDPTPSVARFVEHLRPRMLVAHVDEEVIGYATWRAYGETVHIPNVAVDPSWRGHRVGQLLLEHIRDLARAEGCTRWYLNVKAENTSARRLYERCGFTLAHESWALAITWQRALALPHDLALASSIVPPDDDARIAAAFSFEPQRVAVFRTRESSVLVQVTEPDGQPVGFAAFSPLFPGAYPFVTLRPELAGDLLRAFHGHALHDQFDHTRVTVEADRALHDTLLAGGATLTFALLQLESPL
jgi:GNAT superfamily N-acetyltransferase